MNRKRALILIIILFTGLFPLIPIPIAKASEVVVSISHTYDDIWVTESGNIFYNTFMVLMLDNEIGLRSFLRFRDLAISKSAKINYATLKIYVGETHETPDPGSSVTIYGIDEADCTPFTSDGSLWSLSRPYTSASVNWNTTVWAGYQSVNVTDIVKEIINQYAWSSGNDLGLQILGASDSGQWPRSIEDYSHAYHEGQAELTIVYDVVDEEDEPPGEPELVEQYGPYTIWHINGSILPGWNYSKAHLILGSEDGAVEDYYVPIKVNYGGVRYFADNGVDDPLYTANYPRGLYYNNRTYVVWQGDAGYDPYITYYDHENDTWASPVKVGTNPLSNDYHGAPVILMDNNSYLHVFYGSHVSNLKYAKSDNPEDITAWTAQANPTASCTYPNVISDNGTIYLIYRSGAVNMFEAYRISDDNGGSWGAEQQIIEVSAGGHAIYVYMPQMDGIKINMVWRYYDDVDHWDVYHAYLNLTDSHMYDIAGVDLGTSISKAEADANCLLRDSGIYRTSHMAQHLDENGYPYIIYGIETDTGFEYEFIRWNGSTWIGPQIITDTDQSGNSMDFILHSATSITAFLIGSGDPGKGGDMEKWSWNGTTWSEIKTILSETDAGMPLMSPKVIVDYDEELEFIFTEFGGVGVTGLKVYASDGDDFVSLQDSGVDVYCGELCKTDFGDIRFTDESGSEQIEHWLEEKVDSSYAIYWVKIPDIPASPGNVTILIHYGNEDATSASTEAREDFTTFTEVEEADDIQKTEYHVDFADRRDRKTYLYKDYTADYFQDFAGHLDVKRVAHAEDSWMAVLLMADVVKDKEAMKVATDVHIGASIGGTNEAIYLFEWDAGGTGRPATPASVAISLNTMYYLSYRKYGNATVLDVYSTAVKRHAGGEGDIERMTLTLQSNYSLQYGYVGCSRDSGIPAGGSSDMESLFLRAYVTGEPTQGAWGDIDEGNGVYIVTDENGTVIPTNGNFTDLDDLEDWIDDNLLNGGDPLDPDPGTQGWDTEGPWTRFRTRLYILVIGLGCVFGPVWAMAYKKLDAVGYAGCFIIIVTGVGLLWSITGI